MMPPAYVKAVRKIGGTRRAVNDRPYGSNGYWMRIPVQLLIQIQSNKHILSVGAIIDRPLA
jgi:hypothetical protein